LAILHYKGCHVHTSLLTTARSPNWQN